MRILRTSFAFAACSISDEADFLDQTGISLLKRNGLTFDESRAKADILNDQFCNVSIREDLDDLPTLEESTHPDMPEITVSENGVYILLLNRNPRKTAGPDGVPCRLPQAVAKELAQALTLLCNSSLATGQVPEQWKRANPTHFQEGRQKLGS